MANFTFSKSTFSSSTQEDWGFETVGTFGKLPAMKGKRVQFTKKNLKGTNRVTLQIFPKKYSSLADAIEDNAVENLSCTVPLSKLVRKAITDGVTHNKMLSYLLTLEVQQDASDEENVKIFLFSEKGDGEQLPSFLVDDLAKEKVTFDDIVTF
jgi:hypothetical protein